MISRDRVLFAGAGQQTTQNAEQVISSFHNYVKNQKAQGVQRCPITLQPAIPSSPDGADAQGIGGRKLSQQHAAWTEDRLWDAFAAVAPKKVKGRSQAGRFADLVALVRFALEREQILQPFAQTVNQRFIEWIERNIAKDIIFTPEQRAWLELIRDHIATAISIEPKDLNTRLSASGVD